jgi:hypothetical protein
MQEHLAYGDGVVNARFSMDTDHPIADNYRGATSQNEEFSYLPIPQTPSVEAAECTVTVNFPDMLLSDSAVINNPPAYPITLRDQSLQAEHAINVPVHDWKLLPEKLQPPSFRVHRCHHTGMELGRGGNEFELPNGFPEAIKHISEVPEHVSISVSTKLSALTV